MNQYVQIWMMILPIPNLGVIPLEDLLPLGKTNRSCRSRHGSMGTCLPFAFCPQALLEVKLGQHPKVCQWEGLQPIICCPALSDIIDAKPIPQECGLINLVSKSQLEAPNWHNNLVVGGKISQMPWPWMVAIYRKNFGVETFLCGGSMIGSLEVLSAAHCFAGNKEKLQINRYVVRVGSNINFRGKAYAVASVLLHPAYISSAHYNDLALIRLVREVREDNVRPICLPEENLTHEAILGKNVTVIGWGAQSYGGIRGPELRQVDVFVISRKKCNESYGQLKSSSISKGITDQFICAGVPDGGKDACQADSGGPLMLWWSGRWTLVGIVSFGHSCGRPNFPGVYTSVNYYLKWINENSLS